MTVTQVPTAGSAPSVRPRRRAARRREQLEGLGLVLPAAVIILVTIVVPIAWNVVLSFQDVSLRSLRGGSLFGSFTLEHYADVLTSAGFWRSLWTTVVYSVSTTAGSIAVGLAAALALRRGFRGRGAVRALLLLPYVAPVVAMAFVWQMMLNPQFGIVNIGGTRWLGWDQPIDFLGRAPYALLTVIAFEIWRYFPFALIFIAARMTALPRDVDEAAVLDGATPTQAFRHVTLPQLMPVLALLAVLRMIMTFNKFDDVYLLTGGAAGTEVSAVRVYNQLVGSFDFGGGATTAVVLALVLCALLAVYFVLTGRKEPES
ncbi:carbohydrate ABC transporter permease [Cellulosimicrobium cellulans]|uniref:carbohydrate ABC transporter permease n=1 Tax=Cellulosimicrobium cellulans TaxID=1710 RepID=UPI00130E14D9|nr:sugar ABC transporter permease [Cellulosimicrobium cellulans]